MKPRIPIHSRSRLRFEVRKGRAAGLKDKANADCSRKYATPAFVWSRLHQSPNQFTFARWCGMLVVSLYFIRGTVLPQFLHLPATGLIVSTGLALLLVTRLVIVGGGKWRWSWVVVLLVFANSIFEAEQPISAGLHWLGITMLILAVGPVVLNPVAIKVRSTAWQLTVTGMTTLTGIFVMWYMLHLPCPVGRSPFASFMNQSMLLGPIAGMGIIIGLARAIHRRSWRWGLLAILGLIPLLASGSRVAALASGAAGCFLIIQHKPIIGGLCGLLFLFAVLVFISHPQSNQSSDSFVGALAHKGIANSRADLWQSRVAEFESSPMFGIGVAMGTGSGSAVEEGGAIRVEPGSSYLAILAMTGGLGAIAFSSALGLLLFGYVRSQQGAGLERDILNVVGIFLAVHGVAEGWILGFGSPLCFLFWLWLGKVGDAALQPVRVIAKRRLPAHQRVRSLQPTS